jgi:hypothetical protein
MVRSHHYEAASRVARASVPENGIAKNSGIRRINLIYIDATTGVPSIFEASGTCSIFVNTF